MNLSLTKLPWYAQLGAFAALAVGGVGAFYYYYEMPARAALAQREEELAGLQRNIAIGQATAKKLPEFRAQVGDLESRLSSLRAVLPDEKDAADLLRRMQTVATQSNLTIKASRRKRRSPSSCTPNGRSASSWMARTTTSRCSSTGWGSSPGSSTSAASR